MDRHFCQKCGILLEEDDTFCHSCGSEQHRELALEQTAADADVPGPEACKFCAFCGAVIHSGDRFCEKCGRDQSEPTTTGQSKRHKTAKTPRGEKKRTKKRPLGLVFLALFWCVVGFAFYTAYKTFWSDIPWNEVIAVIIGHKPGTEREYQEGSVPAGTEELPPIAPAEHPMDVLPGENALRDDMAGSPDEGRPIWTERDQNGYNRIAASREVGRQASLPGSVTGSSVRLRGEPNSNSAILGLLKRGDTVEVIGSYSRGGKYNWYNVNFGDLSGWMYGQYLRVEEKEN
jgi:RNA polymerase subunit RPABC4/transcription elongation factor Spt4